MSWQQMLAQGLRWIGLRRSRGSLVLAYYTKFSYLLIMEKTAQKNTSFSLGDHFNRFIDTQVDEGRYSNASDVVRAGLRVLEEREAHLATLRAALIQGENSGPSTPFDFDAFIEKKRRASKAA